LFAAMPKQVLRAGQYLLIGALIISMGGHFALLQTIAWGNMLVDFSSKSSIAEAVEKTFDGGHPCSLCKALKKSKSEDEKKPVLRSESRMEVILPVSVKVPFPRSTAVTFRVTEYCGSFAEVFLAVPTPPPRTV
jgi:hypothetical protein